MVGTNLFPRNLVDIAGGRENVLKVKTTLETSGEEQKIHSKRVWKIKLLSKQVLSGCPLFLQRIELQRPHTRSSLPWQGFETYSRIEAMETYSRIGLVRSYGNLQSYWTSTKLWKLTVVLAYYEAMETYSRIGLVRGYGNLQSYWTSTKLW